MARLNPGEADAKQQLAAARHRQGFAIKGKAKSLLQNARMELAAGATILSTLLSGLIFVEVITQKYAGYVILSCCILSVAMLALLYFRVRVKIGATIHLDESMKAYEHTIDLLFRNFVPRGDISLLQTWVPENQEDRNVKKSEPRLREWGESLCAAIRKHRRLAEKRGTITLKALLLGSETVLRNRVRYRWDLAEQAGADYPFRGDDLDKAVAEAKDRIDSTLAGLIRMERTINDSLRESGISCNFHVKVRFYQNTPCGPLYIFGDQAILAGFFDYRWTSDKAPAVRVGSPGSLEWIYFFMQFETIWWLRPKRKEEPAAETDRLYTKSFPSWKTARERFE
jgi:hypothetical protein